MTFSKSSGESPEELNNRIKAGRDKLNPQGERRVVTILFCDVAGSTRMAEQLDPEEWAEIMDDAFDLLIQPIYRYEGTVARLMGDAILAFFGAPISHEDDPQRAVLAGLDILAAVQPFRERVRRDLGLDFNVRIGINTGSVVVGAIGSDQAMEYTAMGDAVNLAARMEQRAEPGSVQIAEETYRLVEPVFDLEPLGGVDIKGKTRPVQAYRVLGKKERPGRLRGIKGLMSPLIGRELEHQILRQSINDLRQGRGQIVVLIGEAGLGKSRLLDEIHAEWLMADENLGPWLESRAISYDSNRPYGLFQHHLRQICGVEDGDPPDIIRQKVLENMKSFSDQEQDQAMMRSIEILLAIEDSSSEPQLEGEALKRHLFEAFLNFWRQLALRSPVVWALDDLHWVDKASAELLQHVLELSEELPILFLWALRPYRYSPIWQVKLAAETDYPHRYVEISLRPLSEEDSSNLVTNLLAVADLPEHLRKMILRKTEGNPFFVEEVVRTLIEDGVVVQDESSGRWRAVSTVEEISIPDNLQAVITARLDRLDSDVRKTLQLASVIGRSFTRRVLESVSDVNGDLNRHMNDLQRAELIREVTRAPEIEYAFLHELTRDAAYGSILRRNRRNYHRRVGEAIEKLFPERIEQKAHILAQHFEEARDYDKAVHYYTAAGDAAVRLYANEEAITQYTRALELAQATSLSDEQLIYLYTRRGRAYEMDGQYEEALANYGELEALAEERNDPSLQLAALIPQTTIYSIPTAKHDPERGRHLSQRALQLARQLDDHRAEAKALWNLMLLSNFVDRDYPQAVLYGEQALEIARRRGLQEELAYILNDISRVYFEAGRLEDSWDSLEAAQKLWREMENMPMLADSLATMSQGLHLLGDFDQALEMAEEALRISQSIGNLWGQAHSLITLGPLYLERGEVSRAIKCLEESYPLSKQAGFGGAQLFVQVLLSWIYNYLGEFQTAFSIIENARQDSEEDRGNLQAYEKFMEAQSLLLRGDTQKAAEIMRFAEDEYLGEDLDLYFGAIINQTIGEVALANGEYERAMAIADKTLAGMRLVRARIFHPDLYSLKGRVLVELGKIEEGYDALLYAYNEAKEQLSRRSLWPILVALSKLESRLGKPEKAATRRQEAQEIIAYIADHIDDSRLKGAFLNLRQVREIL